MLLDPSLLRSARHVYHAYVEVNREATSHATGVIFDRHSQRGHLTFRPKPLLLPRECFIPVYQLKAESAVAAT